MQAIKASARRAPSLFKHSHRNLSFVPPFSSSGNKVAIAVAKGDGIGPEITDATLKILDSAGASLQPHHIEIGEKLYLSGNSSGIDTKAWDVIRDTRILLKAPITTPSGGGVKSLNVTMRKTLGLFCNIRPCVSYAPFVPTKYPGMDVIIFRENEEDLYAGIEHRQTQDVYQCLKLISRPGSERLIRYAFEYATQHGRKRITCFIKSNIMKMTDGIFEKIFFDVAKEYPSIKADSMILDIAAARLATQPDKFDVCVMQNLAGDIISDIAAEVATGSVGMCGSANIGLTSSMYEAIHGSAPDIAGKNIANPSAMVLSSVMMLNQIGQPDVATRVHNAWLKTIEEKKFTVDLISKEERGVKKALSTDEFTQAVIANLGKNPQQLQPVDYSTRNVTGDLTSMLRKTTPVFKSNEQKTLTGIDIFVAWDKGNANQLGDMISKLNGDGLKLSLITNRGVKVYPQGFNETFCVDHWRLRFRATSDDGLVSHPQILSLLLRISNAGFDFIKTENLYLFKDLETGKVSPGFQMAQGE